MPTRPTSDTWLILLWRSVQWEDLAVCCRITSFLIIAWLEGSSLIHLVQWTCLQRTCVKYTVHLWQHLFCNSSRRVSQPKTQQQHHSTSLFNVLLDIPPFLCQVLRFVSLVLLRLNGGDIRTAPHRSKNTPAQLIGSVHFACLKNRMCLFLAWML